MDKSFSHNGEARQSGKERGILVALLSKFAYMALVLGATTASCPSKSQEKIFFPLLLDCSVGFQFHVIKRNPRETHREQLID